jgi:hypothetical protein
MDNGSARLDDPLKIGARDGVARDDRQTASRRSRVWPYSDAVLDGWVAVVARASNDDRQSARF